MTDTIAGARLAAKSWFQAVTVQTMELKLIVCDGRPR
jgi:hypothetical protein